MNTPNLFDYATSELSQDAFICWLLSWANHPEEEKLYKVAKKLIYKLSNNSIDSFDKVEVKKQCKNIDILCIVDGEKAILIEDKVNAKVHSDQLERYLKTIKSKFAVENIFPVYFKTGDQSNYKHVKEQGYHIFLRDDFMKVLFEGKEMGITNAIYNDFLNYLENIEKAFRSYQTLPVDQWNSTNSWKGFYSALQEELGDGDWGNVPQKNGGFVGFWWSFTNAEVDGHKFQYYLQLEQSKFCFKIYVNDKEVRRSVRKAFRKKLYAKAEDCKIRIKQNGRIGKTMTVAQLRTDYIKTNDKGMLDKDATVESLKQIEVMLRNIEID